MFSKKTIVIKTIGPESMYLLEKSRSVIYTQNIHDIDLVKDLFTHYTDGLNKLKAGIDQSVIYNESYLDYEFKTLFFAIDKLTSLLGNTESEDKRLEASIYQSHIRRQDETIRKIIEESDNY